ncbi:hypothetical protein C8R47DRAFT_1245600 [Mycena vitilis]|nr:hypothetical protein C8R47DRAFT_1245600 [Mycena vitilis]
MCIMLQTLWNPPSCPCLELKQTRTASAIASPGTSIINEQLIQPEIFAKIFCTDLDLPAVPWVETVTNQIRAQLEEHEAIARLELTNDDFAAEGEEQVPECRILSVHHSSRQIANLRALATSVM